MKTYKLLLFLSLSLLSLKYIHAQENTLTFSYDESGNLIERKLTVMLQGRFSKTGPDSTSKMPIYKVSPNPSNTQLNIESSLSERNTKVKAELLTLSGQLVKTVEYFENKTSIDVSNIKSGLYLLIIYHSKSDREVHKIIIND